MISGYEKNGYEGYLGPCSGVWTVIKMVRGSGHVNCN